MICTSCGVLVGVNDPTCYNCGRRNPGLWGFAPALRALGNDLGFVPVVTGGTIILFGLSLILSREVFAPRNEINYLLGSSGAFPVVAQGRWWTLLTAGWLHGNVIHILFSLMWIRSLAPEIANLYGPGRMIIIYTFSSIVGFGLSTALYMLPIHIPFFGGAYLTVGASAPIFGLLGALFYYGHRSGSSHIRQAGLQYALIGGFMGFVLPGIDNSAHLGGFAGGYLISLILDPLKPERVDHLAIAVGCLAVTFVAIIWSVITALPQLT